MCIILIMPEDPTCTQRNLPRNLPSSRVQCPMQSCPVTLPLFKDPTCTEPVFISAYDQHMPQPIEQVRVIDNWHMFITAYDQHLVMCTCALWAVMPQPIEQVRAQQFI